MKVALVHDYLNQLGGAERVLESLVALFPDADIFTLLHDKDKVLHRFDNSVKKTSFLDFKFIQNNHRWFIPLMPLASSRLNLGNDYDLIISDTAGYAKGIRYGKNTYHLSYCHTPLRYAWELDTYFSNPIFKTAFRPIFEYLKRWDYKAGQKPDRMITISNFIAQKIKKYYGRDATVVYPSIDHDKFYFDPSQQPGNYYLAVGRLLHYKRFDLIIEAFRELGLPLKIVGVGPEEERLKLLSRGAPTIEFYSFVDDALLRNLYGGAQAFIFPQVEDFGLVAVEAQACGTPVVAYNDGGAREIVTDNETGILFNEQKKESLMNAVERLEKMKFDRRAISEKSKKFSFEVFRREFLSSIPGKFHAS